LTERLFKHDPPVLEELLAARTLIADQTRAAKARLGDLKHTTFVGTAGTITTLAAMAQELTAYQAARIQGYRLRLEVIKRLEEVLLARRKDERRSLQGLEPGREDIIVAGTVILRTVMDTLEIGECLVSDLGLREGMLIDLLQREAANRL
jgi:exopolyphosphatase/guanosine-5'-triphosphate,3'-diphosphate pyrophosphatase